MKQLALVLMIVGLFFVFTCISDAQNIDANLYKIGIDDVIEIKVINQPELRALTSVSADGTITFPYIGTVYVKGLTISEVKEEITKRLSEGYVKYPVVTVSLVKSMSRKIYTYGEVNRRGEVPFEDNMTVMKALSIIGGVSQDGRFGRMIIRRMREDKKSYEELAETDLNDGLIGNKKIEHLILRPDDILVVERNKTFLIEGEIVNRGRFVLEKDVTVLRALLQAGGVTENGRYGKIKVRRKQGGESGEYKDIAEAMLDDGAIENSEVEDLILRPDDIVVVERNKTFLIEGEVANRGRFVLEKDMTVLRALLQAGGVTENGRYGKIKVRRKQGGEYKDIAEAMLNDGAIKNSEVEDTILSPDDILMVERNKTFLIEGEVVNRGRFALEKDMTVLRALLQAGGVTENGKYGKVKVRRTQGGETGEYKDIAEALLNDATIKNSEVEDMILGPDDILMVERNKTFLIYGEVNKTGEFILKDNMTVFKAITIAGGFTKWGSDSRVKILRPQNSGIGFETIKVNIGDVIDGDASADLSLQPGDTLVVSAGIL